VLRDRTSECATLDRLLEAVRTGESQALVVRGEPGVGKTALLDHMVGRASRFRVMRAAGVQSEMELAFAGLHQLCAPMLDRVDGLAKPQRSALLTAFGMHDGPAPDHFLVGLAVLGLLAEVAEERPLLCVVDDAQWLDHASIQTLTFAARRLEAESVAMVFAVRGPGEVAELAGLADLLVAGLPDGDARALLDSALSWPVDEQVLDRIVAETRGNPLALLELPRGLTLGELAGGLGPIGTAVALPTQIEDSFRRQLAPLDAGTRRLLLVAAAEPLGDPVLVWRAVERLGIGVEAAGPAIAAGLLEIGARMRFRHPLVRSAVYLAASTEERQAVHRVLADATDRDKDPDRHAWHAAQAVSGPDEDVAAALERSAGRARARGGSAAAAAFLERAAELTVDPARRGERALAAAQATHQAGMPESALALLSLAEAGPLDQLERAMAELLRAQIAFAVNRSGDVAPLLLKAARQLEPLDVPLARDTYLEALLAARFAGSPAGDGSVRKVAEAARTAPPPAQPPRASDLLLDGLAIRFTDGFAAGLPVLRQALRAFSSPDLSPEALRWLWLAHSTAAHVWDYETWEVLATRHVQLARDTGALTTLPFALNSRMTVHVLAGELTAAASLVEELEAVTEATGSPLVPLGALLVAGWRGSKTEAFRLIETTAQEVLRRGEGIGLTVTGQAKALLCNSLGRYEEARAAAQQASKHPPEMGLSTWGALVELVEAAHHSGRPEQAAGALEQLAETTRASGTEWALGIEARCRALLGEGGAAEVGYREAIERLGRTRVRGELARAHLVFGEWLRRERRRLDAREQLRVAFELFSGMGMEAFAGRAARELGATGETARKRSVETSSELTAQEAQIARLVREGLSNPEIAARLFLSPRTVEWHLGRIFGKLNITSRRQLRSRAYQSL
jgi:DNA-binding CsgD family transcriptional regulator